MRQPGRVLVEELQRRLLGVPMAVRQNEVLAMPAPWRIEGDEHALLAVPVDELLQIIAADGLHLLSPAEVLLRRLHLREWAIAAAAKGSRDRMLGIFSCFLGNPEVDAARVV